MKLKVRCEMIGKTGDQVGLEDQSVEVRCGVMWSAVVRRPSHRPSSFRDQHQSLEKIIVQERLSRPVLSLAPLHMISGTRSCPVCLESLQTSLEIIQCENLHLTCGKSWTINNPTLTFNTSHLRELHG